MDRPPNQDDHSKTLWHCLVGVGFAFVAFGSTMTYLLQTPDSWHYAALLLAGVVCGLMCLLAWWIRCGDMRAQAKAEAQRAELDEKIDHLHNLFLAGGSKPTSWTGPSPYS